ncbi:unnamed protein product [Sympodiomycopsis kandeliae]
MAKKESKTASKQPQPRPAASFDAELDALFSQAKTKQQPQSQSQSQPRANPTTSTASKRKRDVEVEEETATSRKVQSSDSEATTDEEEFDDDASLDMSEIEKEMEEQGLKRGDDEDEDDTFEDGDEEQVASGDDDGSDSVEQEEEEESDDEDAPPPVHESLAPKNNTQRRAERKQAQRLEESKEDRDKRSIFVGNVPLAAVQSKSMTKDLKKQVIAMSPYPSITRVDALRYRSVAFSVPTGDYSGQDSATVEKSRARSRAYKDALAEADAAENGTAVSRGQVYLNPKQKRKVAYINQDVNDKAKSVNAYITLDQLTEEDYKTLAESPGSSMEKAKKVTPSVLAALIAARLDDTIFEARHLRVDLASSLSLSELVSSGLDKFLSSSASSSSTSPFASALTRVLEGSGGKSREENSRTLFVGNMDFEADEEDVRALFEGLVREERGTPPSSFGSSSSPEAILESVHLPPLSSTSSSPDADSADLISLLTQPTWVTSVRLIRDPATQMGKGFGYIRFTDEECVDELMAIWEAEQEFLNAVKPTKGGSSTRGGLNDDGSRRDFKRRIKLNKRPLRLSRCKATSSSKGKTNKNQKQSSSKPDAASMQTPPRDKSSRRRSMGAPTPGGTSPSQRKEKQQSKSTSAAAALIANPPPKRARTSEEETRLALKRNDPDRQAKRMAKKEKKRKEFKNSSALEEIAGGKKDRVKLDAKKFFKRGAKGKGGPPGGRPENKRKSGGKPGSRK